jgi:peptidyl-tRNA hydrolase, PTH2 family
MDTKQVIVINRGTEPRMRRGKEIAQGSHASLAFLTRRLVRVPGWSITQGRAPGRYTLQLTAAERAWLDSSFAKIVCYVDTEDELLELDKAARAAGLQSHVITDSGRTEFSGPTITALAIGPDWSDKLDAVTGALRLY